MKERAVPFFIFFLCGNYVIVSFSGSVYICCNAAPDDWRKLCRLR